MQALRILLIDDHAMFRQGLRSLLLSVQPQTQVFEAPGVREALADHSPDTVMDVVLLDVGLQGESGIDGMGALRAHYVGHAAAPLRVIVLSGMDSAQDQALAIRRGADAFLSKAASSEVLLSVITGECLLQVAQPSDDPIDQAVLCASRTPMGDSPSAKLLTLRQLDVLALLAKGNSNKAIGRELGIAENTVRTHLVSLFAQLGVNSRTAAVVRAQQLSLLPAVGPAF